MKHRKFKFLTILLVSLMLMGSMPVFAAETTMVPETFEDIQAAFPQVQLTEGDPNVKAVQMIDGEIVYAYQSIDPDAEPVGEYTKEFLNGNATLTVFSDGSYYMTSMERVIPSGIIPLATSATYTVSYRGTMGGRLSFNLTYSTSTYKITSGPNNISITPPGTQGWSRADYGTNSAKTYGYVTISVTEVVYNEWGDPVGTVTAGTFTVRGHISSSGNYTTTS